jgi:hypothetical protein
MALLFLDAETQYVIYIYTNINLIHNSNRKRNIERKREERKKYNREGNERERERKRLRDISFPLLSLHQRETVSQTYSSSDIISFI